MYVSTKQGKVEHINGEEVRSSKWSFLVQSPTVRGENMFAFLERAGEEGWELVTLNQSQFGMTFVFKRPKP
jgi:hypothetical protein